MQALVIIISVLVLLAACRGQTRPVVDVPAVHIEVRGNDLIYRGSLTEDANEELFTLVASANDVPQRLVITSGGGNVEAGMELGRWIFQRGLEVHVPEYCISSCANYVFVAGARKVLDANALVLWHGGALQKEWNDDSLCENAGWPEEQGPCDERMLQDMLKTQLQTWRRAEAAFFEMIGVDQRITVLGQEPEYECRGEGHVGWYYSLEDLESLGVTNVLVAGGEWLPQAPSRDFSFCRVELDRPDEG